MEASNPDWLPETVRNGKRIGVKDSVPEDFKIQLGRSAGHHLNFIDAVIGDVEPMATAEIGHRTATICHLNNIAMRVGRPLEWDPVLEELIADPEAGKFLKPNMREPWRV